MKKIFLPMFLIFGLLFFSSFAYAGLFGSWGDGDFAGQAYSTEEYGNYMSEEITCYFQGSDEEQTFFSRKGQCTGVEECTVEVAGNVGERLTWQNTCGDQYSYTEIDGKDKEITFSCKEKITEMVTCVFDDASGVKSCSSKYGSCSGNESCEVEVEAPEGSRVLWRSSCSGFAYHTQDGQDEEIHFECGGTVSERVICDFRDPSAENFCHSNYGSCVGRDRCIVEISGPKNERVRWSTPEGDRAYTLLDGTNEYARMEEGQSQVEEMVTCKFPIDSTQYECSSDVGDGYCQEECINEECTGNCTARVYGQDGQNVVWSSNVPKAINRITKIDGIDEEVEFTTYSENCLNGEDDDHDGKIDCEDSDCYGYIDSDKGVICVSGVWREYDCEDGLDNDGNGVSDCRDINCYDAEICEYPEVSCNDSFDNDGDGLIDMEDPTDCNIPQPTFELNPERGYSGQEIDVEGSNFESGETLRISFEWGEVHEVVTTQEGTFTTSFIVPSVELGTYTIEIPAYSLSSDFEVIQATEPTFMVSPTNGEVGELIRASGTNLESGELRILFDDTVLLVTAVGQDGSFIDEFSVPDASIGEHEISIEGYPELRTSFEVVQTIVSQDVTAIFDSVGISEVAKEAYYSRSDDETGTRILLCRAEENTESCTDQIRGPEGVVISWYSGFGQPEPATTTLTERPETITFTDNVTREIVTCTFDDGSTGEISEQYTCTNVQGGWSCTGTDSCSMEVEGDAEIAIQWESTVPESQSKVTTLDGVDERIDFETPTYMEAWWTCNDGFSVESAMSPSAITEQTWLQEYINPSCGTHEGVSDYGFVSSEIGDDSLIGQAFSSLFGSNRVAEKITCVFEGDTMGLNTCYSDLGRCEGTGYCSFNVTGDQGSLLSVRSSIVNAGSKEVLIDGVDERLIFSGQEQVTDTVTCLFRQSEPLEQTCYSDRGECMGVDKCTVKVSGRERESLIWHSTVEGSDPVETILMGNEKTIEFIENKEQETIPDTQPQETNQTNQSDEQQVNITSPSQEVIPSSNQTNQSQESVLPDTNNQTNQSEAILPENNQTNQSSQQESSVPDQSQEEIPGTGPEPGQGSVIPPGLNRFNWDCDNGLSIQAYNPEQMPESNWIDEAQSFCIVVGSSYPDQSDPSPTGYSIYIPKSYAGAVLYELGLIG